MVASGVRQSDRCLLVSGQYRADVIMGLYEHVDVTVSARLHGAVFSIVAGKPVLAIDYLPKVSGFMLQVGLGENVVTLDQLSDTDSLVAMARRLVANRIALGEQMKKSVAIAKFRANVHFNVATNLLGR